MNACMYVCVRVCVRACVHVCVCVCVCVLAHPPNELWYDLSLQLPWPRIGIWNKEVLGDLGFLRLHEVGWCACQHEILRSEQGRSHGDEHPSSYLSKVQRHSSEATKAPSPWVLHLGVSRQRANPSINNLTMYYAVLYLLWWTSSGGEVSFHVFRRQLWWDLAFSLHQ